MTMEIYMKIYHEAKVQSDNAKHETRCDEAQREDLHHDLYLKAVQAMERFDPTRGVKPETFAFAHLKGNRKMAKRSYLRRVNKVGSIEMMGKIVLDQHETLTCSENTGLENVTLERDAGGKYASKAQGVVSKIDLVPGDLGRGYWFTYETEEMKKLFRFVLTRLAPIERTIIIALTKCRGNETKARELLAAQGIEYKKSTFNEKIVPGLLKKVKGIIF